MLTVSAREFRTNQRHYLDQVKQGLELLITRKKDAFKVSSVKKDDTLMTKEEFFAKIDRAKEQARQGLGYEMKPGESFEDFFQRVKKERHVQG
ncbi:MAG: type II toxin-antitoxin system Phd/YefM family antitoxin [Bacteroidales bacterium]|nr:type II toxin-antitoxin system Phd/YefM family antitoxin [Bacteroidales bacterium]